MSGKDLLEGKRVLMVDDEPDILEILESLLPMCKVQKATSFEGAKKLLETQTFDLAILDIMGVKGYQLLEIAKNRGVISVMLTAHALSVEDTIRSHKQGAASYVPKDEINQIDVFLRDILEAKELGKSLWWKWMDRLGGSFYEKKFGADWKDKDKDFWKHFPAW